ncbi:F8H, partial [Symbiodinium natans]
EQVPQLKPLLQSQIYCSRGQWGTDVQLHDFFVTSNIQTDDPSEADFFFVPGYAICVLEGNIYNLDEVDELYKELVVALPYFNASGGRDHIFVFGSGMAQSVFQSWEEYIPQAIVLTPETELFNDFAWVAIPPYRPFKDVVIPGSLDLIEVIKALEKSKPLQERRYLTAFFGRADIARALLGIGCDSGFPPSEPYCVEVGRHSTHLSTAISALFEALCVRQSCLSEQLS